jgi:hypothetical protein
MKWNDKDLVCVTKVDRHIVNAVSPILQKLKSNAIADIILDYPDLLKDLDLTQSESTLGLQIVAMAGDNAEIKERYKKSIEGSSLSDEADTVYALFPIAVDKTGWSELEKAEFEKQETIDSFDIEEVRDFIAPFRSRISK